jgi:large subunit ribosomal protein L20
VFKARKGYLVPEQQFRTAKQAVMKSGNYAYIGRKQRKRNFRSLWITRISAACRANGVNYSTFMNGVSKAGITLNRKMLSEIAIGDPAAFSAIVEQAKAALYAKKNVRFLKQTGRLRLDGRVDML